MTLRDGNATFDLVGCEDWSDPRRSEGAQLASVRIRDLGEVTRRMEGCNERREQLVALAAWSKETNEKLQNTKIPMDDPRRQDWAATLASIQGVQRMVEHAGPNGLEQHRLKALGYVQEMEVQMNGSFPSLKLGNPAHREMVRHFNEHLRQGHGVASAGGWTIDPTVMANYYSNRIHEGANILSGGMNTPQKLKAYMRWFSRCEAERDSMEDALVMLQIEADRQGIAA
jgi:hypothetical protein